MNKKIVIGITTGDSNGIGYEVIIKALADARIMELCIPIVYGSSKTFGAYKRQNSEAEDLATNIINTAKDFHPKRINIINCVPDHLAIDPGQSTAHSAEAAKISLEAAVSDIKEGLLDAIVTAPVNKKALAQNNFQYTGQTEYLTHEFQAENGLMFMCSDRMRVGLVTNHTPISKISSTITKELILAKLNLMNLSLKQDFNIVRPKIAILGLNPHSGDAGLLGEEEITTIEPAIKEAFKQNILAFGPFSPDGFFGNNMQYNYDAVLAMYHDQGLIPFKTLSFDNGVNYTAGLPIVRTSPDHGTAFDLAGKNLANPQPMLAAIYMAIDIVRNRANYKEMTKDALIIEAPKFTERRSGKVIE